MEKMTSSNDISDDVNFLFRNVCPTDLAEIIALEKESYPKDEAASRSQLQYRQHHAASFFRCAVIMDEDNKRTTASADINNMDSNSTSLNGIGQLIGFVTATRCHSFDEESMKVHDPMGKLLAIHSVVVKKEYRNHGIGKKMVRNYIESLKMMELKYGIEKVVLISKKEKLMFYLDCGFSIMGKSTIVHGVEPWYDCECVVNLPARKKTGLPGAMGRVSSNRRNRSRVKYSYSVIDSFAVNARPIANGIASVDKKVAAGGGTLSASGKGTGNPAAVVVIPKDEADKFQPDFEEDIRWMKTTAREFNLSETAFIWEVQSSGEDQSKPSGEDQPTEVMYNIRYYTCNGTEVDLCGHATLAASLVVFQDLFSRGKRNPAVSFRTNRGVMLKANPVNPNANITQNASIRIVMEFPSKDLIAINKGSEEETKVLKVLRESLFPEKSLEDLMSIVKHVGVDDGGDDLLVELSAEGFTEIPHAREINYTPMMNYDGYKRGIIVCCEVSEEMNDRVDFYSRFFGPKVGIEEDPVTGSAHCVLGPFFAKKMEKDFIVGMQKSQRGGIVECTLVDSVVRIAGSAVTTMSGSLYI